MLVCKLTYGKELHASNAGNPYYIYPPSGLRPAGYTGNVLSHIDREDKRLVNTWQADPNNDSLRARGDARWQAACSFTARPTWQE